ncbi:somatostatin receptor type 5 [Hydra vulgaris]|uniref:somatostatin receptor type 5 n=1 Tax=Hydra vulgaris TaxID=6087 RepID=UPI000640BA22|nr:somatostatin receptor type 5 [Hydra vulgaris]XP_047131078.1 somatostatin receptor type 5 [Hydra vulgaris]XP_047131079.1 somatostatin receptor type 5 [Hydra vulgaris]
MSALQSNITSSINKTSSTPLNKCHLAYANILLVVGYLLVIVIGSIGNTLVVIIFKFKLKKRPIIDLLIFYLAVFDGLGSLFNPLVFLYWTLTCYQRWDFGWLGCKIIPPFSRIVTNISTGVILIMAIDRCRSIVFPLKRRFRRTTIHIAMFATVAISIVWEVYYIKSLIIDKFGRCNPAEVNDPSYAHPLIAMVTARSLIFIVVFTATTTAVYIKLHNCERMILLRSSSSKTTNKNKSVMKMLVIMATVFVLSVIPRDILHLTFTISWQNPSEGIPHARISELNSWLRLLQISNGIYNVFIYGKMYKNFWKSVQMMLRCKYTPFGVFESQMSHFDPRKSNSLYSDETRRVTLTIISNETDFGGMNKYHSIKSKSSQCTL